MSYEEKLQFTKDFLKELNISSFILTNPEDVIPSKIDLGLRALLFGTENYLSILENSLKSAKDKTIYRFYDEYDCRYIFMRLPDNTYFYIGPYLLSAPDKTLVENKAKYFSIPETKIEQLIIYYFGLPVAENENLLLCLVNTLGKSIWGEDFTLEYIEYEIRDRTEPLPVTYIDKDPYDAPVSLKSLEENYENEKILMDAVSKGKLHLVIKVASSVFNNGTQLGVNDSLRNRKNYLIILKTLLRKAAEYGGVHPLHIHRLSSSYAKQIENVKTVKESLSLQEEMIREFCLLVKNHSLSKYSYYVGKAITLINYDLSANLSLKDIANELSVNSSYLSKLFHKEYGCTLTDYVNRKRIERALILLKDTSKTVQDIATECGFQDTTYFIRLFKKHLNLTPAAYREQKLK